MICIRKISLHLHAFETEHFLESVEATKHHLTRSLLTFLIQVAAYFYDLRYGNNIDLDTGGKLSGHTYN